MTASTPYPAAGSASSGSQRARYGRCGGSLGLQSSSDAQQEIPHLDAQPLGDALEHLGRRVLLTAFDLREIRDGDVGAFGDLPQGEPALGPDGPQRLTDGREQIRLPWRRVD